LKDAQDAAQSERSDVKFGVKWQNLVSRDDFALGNCELCPRYRTKRSRVL